MSVLVCIGEFGSRRTGSIPRLGGLTKGKEAPLTNATILNVTLGLSEPPLLISRTEYADVVLGRGDVHETNTRYCRELRGGRLGR